MKMVRRNCSVVAPIHRASFKLPDESGNYMFYCSGKGLLTLIMMRNFFEKSVFI